MVEFAKLCACAMSVISERALLDKYTWLHSQMSNYLKKITENTPFGTTDL